MSDNTAKFGGENLIFKSTKIALQKLNKLHHNIRHSNQYFLPSILPKEECKGKLCILYVKCMF